MSTTTPLTDSINNLTTYANSVTGASDTNLSDAVATLASGYGGGGGEPDWDEWGHTTTPIYDKITIGNVYVNRTGAYGGIPADIIRYEISSSSNLNAASYLFNRCLASVIVMPFYEKAFGSSSGYPFQNCARLKTVDFKIASIIQQAFTGCSVFDTLIIRKTDGVCALNNTNAFNSTKFASGGTGGTLYVPQSLVSSYQSASNWSTILGYANNSIAAIEGSIYETKYADGTPIT